MRNHAFIRTVGGWRSSPAFDLDADVRPWVEFVTSVDSAIGRGVLGATT